MANTLILSGNIGAPPEASTTKNGANKVKFSFCFKNEGKESDKNNKNWINCVAYKGTADVVSKFLGTVHYIEFITLKSKGNAQTQSYDQVPTFAPTYDSDSNPNIF